MVDPLTDLEIDVQSFDIPRLVTVYPDKAGMRWWTKAWFNNREEGEASVEISRQVAVKFIQINPEKPDVPLNKNDAFQKVQKRHVQEKR